MNDVMYKSLRKTKRILEIRLPPVDASYGFVPLFFGLDPRTFASDLDLVKPEKNLQGGARLCDCVIALPTIEGAAIGKESAYVNGPAGAVDHRRIHRPRPREPGAPGARAPAQPASAALPEPIDPGAPQ